MASKKKNNVNFSYQLLKKEKGEDLKNAEKFVCELYKIDNVSTIDETRVLGLTHLNHYFQLVMHFIFTYNVLISVVDPGFTKGEGHKIMDLLSITKTSKWEVVKNSASPKRLFYFFIIGLHGIFPILRAFPVQIINKHTFFSSISWPQISLFHLSLIPHPPLIQKGGAHSPCLFILLLGHAPIWPKRGGGGMCLKCPPPRSTYAFNQSTWSPANQRHQILNPWVVK